MIRCVLSIPSQTCSCPHCICSPVWDPRYLFVEQWSLQKVLSQCILHHQIHSMFLDCVLYVAQRLKIRKCLSLSISLLICLLSVDSFSVAELHDGIDVHQISNYNDVFSFSAWDTSSIGEEPASFILDIIDVLSNEGDTVAKGE